jgi:hypothetical protein
MPKKTHPLSLAKWKFAKHRAQAKFRNIEFKFSFEEWYQWWLNNGVDKNIYQQWASTQRPCMCRNNDTGPYEVNNVYFATHVQNTRDSTNHRGGAKQKFQYRWADQTVSSSFLLKQGIHSKYHPWFKIDVYDHYNQLYSKTLEQRYFRKCIWCWIYQDKKYTTASELAQHLKCSTTTVHNKSRKGLFKKKFARPDISLEDYIRQKSFFPDPYIG